MRMIQIQLLLSNTLHRQLFIVNLLKRYEVGRRASVSTIIVCRRRENVRETCRTGAEKTFAFLKIPLDKNREMVYNICVRMGVRGYSLMVKLQLPKLATRVRFPLPAPIEKGHLGVPAIEQVHPKRRAFNQKRYNISVLCRFYFYIIFSIA